MSATELANVEGEYLLVAALLFDSRRLDAVADILSPEAFFDPFFGRLYALLVQEHGKGNALTALTVRPFLEDDPSYQSLGGTKFLAEATQAASALINVPVVARQIADLARRRSFVAALREVVTECIDPSLPLEALVETVDGATSSLTGISSGVVQTSGEDAMMSLIRQSEQPKRSVRCPALPTMNELLGGMRPKQLVIGAARPGMGKTATAISYALGAARAGHGVLFISLEMSATELSARIAADLTFNGRTGVPFSDINSDHPSRQALKAMGDAAAELADLPFHIVDAGSLTLGRLDMIVRRYKRRLASRGQSLDLVVVDYLQLLRCDDRLSSAYETVSEVSRRLKALAKDHDVAVFALAQLSREVERRADKRPQLADLRDSGQIEQDADAVLFLYRHEYYLNVGKPDEGSPEYAEWKQAIEAVRGGIDFICAKRRNGVTGSARGFFHGQYQAVRG